MAFIVYIKYYLDISKFLSWIKLKLTKYEVHVLFFYDSKINFIMESKTLLTIFEEVHGAL